MTLNKIWLLVPDWLAFQKLLIYWDSPTQSSLGLKKKVSGSSLAENASLMWPDCFELIRREQQLK